MNQDAIRLIVLNRPICPGRPDIEEGFFKMQELIENDSVDVTYQFNRIGDPDPLSTRECTVRKVEGTLTVDFVYASSKTTKMLMNWIQTIRNDYFDRKISLENITCRIMYTNYVEDDYILTDLSARIQDMNVIYGEYSQDDGNRITFRFDAHGKTYVGEKSVIDERPAGEALTEELKLRKKWKEEKKMETLELDSRSLYNSIEEMINNIKKHPSCFGFSRLYRMIQDRVKQSEVSSYGINDSTMDRMMGILRDYTQVHVVSYMNAIRSEGVEKRLIRYLRMKHHDIESVKWDFRASIITIQKQYINDVIAFMISLCVQPAVNALHTFFQYTDMKRFIPEEGKTVAVCQVIQDVIFGLEVKDYEDDARHILSIPSVVHNEIPKYKDSFSFMMIYTETIEEILRNYSTIDSMKMYSDEFKDSLIEYGMKEENAVNVKDMLCKYIPIRNFGENPIAWLSTNAIRPIITVMKSASLLKDEMTTKEFCRRVITSYMKKIVKKITSENSKFDEEIHDEVKYIFTLIWDDRFAHEIDKLILEAEKEDEYEFRDPEEASIEEYVQDMEFMDSPEPSEEDEEEEMETEARDLDSCTITNKDLVEAIDKMLLTSKQVKFSRPGLFKPMVTKENADSFEFKPEKMALEIRNELERYLSKMREGDRALHALDEMILWSDPKFMVVNTFIEDDKIVVPKELYPQIIATMVSLCMKPIHSVVAKYNYIYAIENFRNMVFKYLLHFPKPFQEIYKEAMDEWSIRCSIIDAITSIVTNHDMIESVAKDCVNEFDNIVKDAEYVGSLHEQITSSFKEIMTDANYGDEFFNFTTKVIFHSITDAIAEDQGLSLDMDTQYSICREVTKKFFQNVVFNLKSLNNWKMVHLKHRDLDRWVIYHMWETWKDYYMPDDEVEFTNEDTGMEDLDDYSDFMDAYIYENDVPDDEKKETPKISLEMVNAMRDEVNKLREELKEMKVEDKEKSKDDAQELIDAILNLMIQSKLSDKDKENILSRLHNHYVDYASVKKKFAGVMMADSLNFAFDLLDKATANAFQLMGNDISYSIDEGVFSIHISTQMDDDMLHDAFVEAMADRGITDMGDATENDEE